MSNILLMTGASSSIGCSTIKSLKSNYKIIALYNENKSKLDKLKYTGLIPYKIDLADTNQLDKFMKFLEDEKLIPNKVLHIASKKLTMSSFENMTWLTTKIILKFKLGLFLEYLNG